MVIESPTQKKTSLIIAFMCSWAKALLEKFKAKTIEITKKTKKIGKDDPRRIIHSLKVALALTLVSMFYFLRPLYDGFGAAGMWAVLTVVVIFEFTVGATLCKGLNRGLATFLAGAFGIGADYLANLLGETGEPILLGLLVFILGAASTFTRFFPVIKARYDYGAVIFLLTFSLVAISGYRVDEIIELAHQRLSTIIAGGAICIVVSIFICPVWAGEDLHNLLVLNLEKLASFLEGFGGDYFKFPEDGGSTMISKDGKSYLQGYKSVLNSSTEESLANFAWWEPCHGQFRFRHPWKQYLKIGGLTRQCAYKVEALSGYLHFDIQEPSEFQRKIQESCYKMSSELAKALKELASVIKTMSCPSCSNIHIEKSKIAVDELKTALLKVSSSLEKEELIEIIPSITAASILIEIINCVEKITESVHDLSLLANFKKGKQQLLQRGIVKPISEGDSDGDDHVVITVEKEGPQVNKNNKTMEL